MDGWIVVDVYIDETKKPNEADIHSPCVCVSEFTKLNQSELNC